MHHYPVMSEYHEEHEHGNGSGVLVLISYALVLAITIAVLNIQTAVGFVVLGLLCVAALATAFLASGTASA